MFNRQQRHHQQKFATLRKFSHSLLILEKCFSQCERHCGTVEKDAILKKYIWTEIQVLICDIK